MNATKILDNSISKIKISSLPTAPTNQATHGGSGYGSNQIKSMFDNLSILIIDHLNTLIDDISAAPEESISAAMQTGIYNGHTLADLFADLQNGNASAYLIVNGKPLATELYEIKEAIRALGGEI